MMHTVSRSTWCSLYALTASPVTQSHGRKTQAAFSTTTKPSSSAQTPASSSSSAAPRLNKYSSTITQPKARGGAQSMLYACGLSEADMNKAQVGIASVWWEGNPCNMHLNELSASVKKGVDSTDGLIGLRFNTIGVSDAISMGTDGMSYSLPSRDIIADSIETVMHAQWYDAAITVPGCDKNMPGCLMAMCRVNRPSLMIYGGAIAAGQSCRGLPIDIISSFQAYGETLNGTITETDRADIVRHACPGQGSCGGMYTANTMASAIEAMGMMLPFSSSIPAAHPAKLTECVEAGKAVRRLLAADIKPTDILTKQAFENGITTVMALGGSTNAVLHLLAVARALSIDLSLADFQRISDRTPLIADLKPSGKYVMADLHTIGGVPAVLKYLLAEGYLHGDCMTVTGQTLAQNLASVRDLGHVPGVPSVVKNGAGPGNQDLIVSLSTPLKETGHLQILRGNLAPDGAVAKITGKEGLEFEGKALVYDGEEAMLAAFQQGKIPKGEKLVIIIRYEGPKGGPGMPEMLTPTSIIMGAGMGKDVALVTDGRFSGGSHGFIIGHVCPEAAVGGPIALVQDGDIVRIGVQGRVGEREYGGVLEVKNVDAAELSRRKAKWSPKTDKFDQGILRKYIKSVTSASEGCVTDA